MRWKGTLITILRMRKISYLTIFAAAQLAVAFKLFEHLFFVLIEEEEIPP